MNCNNDLKQLFYLKIFTDSNKAIFAIARQKLINQ